VPDRAREDFGELAQWLLGHDASELARRHTVPGAETYGFKAQAVRLETSYDEVGFAYEVYPAGQFQRRSLAALVMLTGSGDAELYQRG
jgi:hypothetical protein